MAPEDDELHLDFDKLLERNPDFAAALKKLNVKIDIDAKNRYKARVTIPHGECNDDWKKDADE